MISRESKALSNDFAVRSIVRSLSLADARLAQCVAALTESGDSFGIDDLANSWRAKLSNGQEIFDFLRLRFAQY